jgi:hypothetical protein
LAYQAKWPDIIFRGLDEAALRITGPPESPEELAALERRLWRGQFLKFVVYVVVFLGVALAVIAVVEEWGCFPMSRACTTN